VQAITIVPGQANSVALVEMPEPLSQEGSILVRALNLGVCGTDFELIAGDYGWPPAGSPRLILGHESLGMVERASEGSDFNPGDLLVGIVRRPDPKPCVACAVGEWDMCRNGLYTERGIKEKHGFGAEHWRIEPEFAIKVEPELREVGILIEPASVLAKAWEHIEHIGRRAHWRPRTLLVTGAGPIGLLAALMGRQRGFEVYVLDQMIDGPKPKLVEDLGARYVTGPIAGMGFAPDVVIECTGAACVLRDSVLHLNSGGILAVVGSSAHNQTVQLNVAEWNRSMVLGNTVTFGVVNANRRHYEHAADALRRASRNWLRSLITRREPLANWRAAFERRPGDVKVVIDF
jgi:threonine dehydrogenase-like Zn-dependent dehydrogenase